MPFALGPDQYVKYKLEPVLQDTPPAAPPTDPTYLADDLKKRLGEGAAGFRFMVQKRTNPDTMPLDRATVAWPEDESPFVHVADVELPQQDVGARGQPAYGENLSWNIWRVTADHAPQGSIAEARRVVYYAAAETRRNANGVPDGEPDHARPSADLGALQGYHSRPRGDPPGDRDHARRRQRRTSISWVPR